MSSTRGPGKYNAVTAPYVRRKINKLENTAPSVPDAKTKEAVLSELQRVLSTPAFSSATRSAVLLRFLVNETLNGRAERLKEYVLGVEGLGRPASFDPRIDPIARVEASRLRNKLDLCYPGGEAGAVRIVLPRGTYVPEFHHLQQPTVAHSSKQFPPAISMGMVAIAALLVGLAAAFLFTRGGHRSETIRFSVLPPKDSVIESVAVSPDATRLVIAASTHSTPHLYLRSLSTSFDLQVMTGTDGAEFPFWSPDGRFIGFFADRKLKTIDVNGGEPRILADAPLGRGGVWTKEGDIIFASGQRGPLMQISVTGTKQAAPFSTLDVSHGEASHLWPSLLPDGTHIAYLVINQDHSADAIVAADYKNPSHRSKIAAAFSSMGFSSDQSKQWTMYFLRDGALVSQELNRDTLLPIGEPAVVAPQLDFDPLTRYCLLSVAQNDIVTYVPGTPFRYRFAWMNRSGGEIATLGEPSDYYAFKMSPDDTQLLVNQTDPRFGNAAVSKVDLIRGTVLPLTSRSVNFLPVWSPDGEKVAFARSVAAERGMRLSVLPKNGGIPQTLLEISGPIFPSDWSSDGKLIAYTGFAPLAKVTVVSVANSKASEVWSYSPFPHSAGGGVFLPAESHHSPKWIAYTSDESGRDEVYVQSFPDGRNKLQISASGGSCPLWRRDGQELFYLDEGDDLVAVERIKKRDFSFGVPHKLFHMPTLPVTAPPYGLSYASTSDGQKFIVRVPDSRGEMPSIRIIGHWRSQ
jgi:Tol biopolymer transport system component